MNGNCLNKLEYNKILELLAQNSITYLGKDICLHLSPSFENCKVENLLNETLEACNFLYRRGNLPMCEIPNISKNIKSLESSYSLNTKGLLDIAKVLKLSRELKEYFYQNDELDLSSFSILDSHFSCFYVNKKIENEILSSILDEDNISDTASSTLANLRRNRRKLEADIKESLNHIIHSSSYSKYIMESIITIRNDRYVIPVKEEFRSNIKGFIHDVSSSGSTVFIEPIAVFETNNKINNLKIEESIEIEKILEKLSSLLFPICNELNNNIYLIGQLDFIFAKAKLAKQMNAICPYINKEKYISLKQARHPLIDSKKVVPINLSIGKQYSSLIITGPNTGGKTVSLKTVGLLTLMACSGLHIPAEENSSIYVFDNIFADIGDEQSIQESLSTFSAHMLNIVDILKHVTPDSLVLLDELGSGTDPIEGASLATAILEHLHELGLLTIATTHYQEIKNYALVTNGFENASSEFDLENLKPTYHLLVGIPGKSNAFSISEKLGLSHEILNKAKSFLKQEHINIEELLKNIYNDKLEIENSKGEITKNLNQIELLRKSLENENRVKKENELQLIEKSRLEAQNLILSAKEKANLTIKEIENIYSKWKFLDELDFQNMNDSEIASLIRNFKNNDIKTANKYRNDLHSSLNSFTLINNKNQSSTIEKNTLKVGMKVKLKSMNEIGTITSLSGKGNRVQVQVGNAKINVSCDDIINIVNSISQNEKHNIIHKSSSNVKAKNVSTEINVIGQNIEEACFVIDKYLDDCAICKLQSVRIVHGKGTGKLRQGIHSFLQRNPHVKSFRLGTFGEGEMGVTVVELK